MKNMDTWYKRTYKQTTQDNIYQSIPRQGTSKRNIKSYWLNNKVNFTMIKSIFKTFWFDDKFNNIHNIHFTGVEKITKALEETPVFYRLHVIWRKKWRQINGYKKRTSMTLNNFLASFWRGKMFFLIVKLVFFIAISFMVNDENVYLKNLVTTGGFSPKGIL